MERAMIPWQGWVVVLDGAKALMLRNDGDAELVNLKTVDVFEEHQPPAHELGTDRPGRVHQSHGTARSATEETDFHEAGEAAFIAGIAAGLDRAVREHAIKSLTVVAPPKALGVLREHLTPAVRAVVGKEIAKDLVHLSTGEIEKHLAG